MNRTHLIFAIIAGTSFMHTTVFPMLIKQDPVLAAIKWSNGEKFKSAFNNTFPNFPIDDNNPKKKQIVKRKHKPALDEAKKQALQTLNNRTFLDDHRTIIMGVCGVGGMLLGCYALRTIYAGSDKLTTQLCEANSLRNKTIYFLKEAADSDNRFYEQIDYLGTHFYKKMLLNKAIDTARATLFKTCAYAGTEIVTASIALSKAYQAYYSKWYKNNATEIVEILDTISPAEPTYQSINLIDLNADNNGTEQPTDETESN